MKVLEIHSIPAKSNPFNHDLFNMGTEIGKNVTVMYENFPDQFCKSLIVVDKTTGKRVQILFDKEEK